MGRIAALGIDQVAAGRVCVRSEMGENPLVLAQRRKGPGLAIIKQLVTKHKGWSWMASRGLAGDGYTFSFTMPVYQTEVQGCRK